MRPSHRPPQSVYGRWNVGPRREPACAAAANAEEAAAACRRCGHRPPRAMPSSPLEHTCTMTKGGGRRDGPWLLLERRRRISLGWPRRRSPTRVGGRGVMRGLADWISESACFFLCHAPWRSPAASEAGGDDLYSRPTSPTAAGAGREKDVASPRLCPPTSGWRLRTPQNLIDFVQRSVIESEDVRTAAAKAPDW